MRNIKLDTKQLSFSSLFSKTALPTYFGQFLKFWKAKKFEMLKKLKINTNFDARIKGSKDGSEKDRENKFFSLLSILLFTYTICS